MDMQWIPRSLNEQADSISKSIDYDDWGVSEELFDFMNQLWGPVDFDRFANHENGKVLRFSSAIWNPGWEEIDAFCQNWAAFNNRLVLPIYLVPKTIRHLTNCEAAGTLIVQKWKPTQFWPLFYLFIIFCLSKVIGKFFDLMQNLYVWLQNFHKYSKVSFLQMRSKVILLDLKSGPYGVINLMLTFFLQSKSID